MNNHSCRLDGNILVSYNQGDRTHTNEYSIVRITRNTEAECNAEFWGQLTDGIFENSRTGRIVEI